MQGRIGDKRLIKGIKLCQLGKQYMLRENSLGLYFIKSTEPSNADLNLAAERNKIRRAGMRTHLETLYENPAKGEKFYRHFKEMGDYNEI